MVLSHLSYQFSLTGMLSHVRLSYKVIFPSVSNGLKMGCLATKCSLMKQLHKRDTEKNIFYCCFALRKF